MLHREPLTDREWATILAALRYWQDEMSPHGGAYPRHFAGGVAPLNAAEIDELCERLNEAREP